MSDLKLVSPLLDGYTVEKTVITQADRSWYSVRHTASGECFILKHLSIPASDAQVRALILSGIYENEQDVLAYYTGVVSDMKRELELGKKLAETGCFAGAVNYQIEQKTDGIGYDVYILQELQLPLNELITRNGMTHLRAVNLGIDLCDAIIACREAGYLFGNIKPENIFLIPTGRFLLGDLGLISLQDLDYASIPEAYIGPFSAPELSDIAASPNLTIDLYALGMVLYRIYNGNQGPFEDENTNEAMANKLRLSGKPLPTPIYADYELAGIINKACSYRIENRYTSPEQLKEALILYLQRNQIPDSLIVPPLVVDPEPIAPEPEVNLEEPLRIVDLENLDANFKASFAPSAENAGTDTAEPAPVAAPTTVAVEDTAPATAEAQKEPIPVETPPVDEAPVAEALVIETPVVEAPVVETPVAETPVAGTPVTEAPVVETPVVETPVTEAPVSETPVAEAPKVSDSSAPKEERHHSGRRHRHRQPLIVNIDDTKTPEDPNTASASDDVRENAKATAAADTPATQETTSDPISPIEETPAPEPQSETDGPAITTDDLLGLNTVTGPKMPTGALKMKKKNKGSKKHKSDDTQDSLTPEAPTEKTETDTQKDITVPVVEVPSPQKTEEIPVSTPEEDIDIDQLIASVNEVVGTPDEAPALQPRHADGNDRSHLTMHVAPIDSGYYDPIREDTSSEKDEFTEKKKSKWLPITIIVLLSAALIAVVAFLLNNYYVNITKLELLDYSTESLTVQLDSPDAQECFIVTCTDNYGNSYPRTIHGSSYTFTGLREKTAYTVTVIASEYHRLRSGKSYTMTVTTPGSTQITEFTARRGTQEGDVVLNLAYEGPSPEEWALTYTDENGVLSGPFSITEQSYLVTGLKEGSTYTFSIQAPEDLFLSGQTTVEYTLLPIVTVDSLHIADVSGNSISVAWMCAENTPAEWNVTCEAEDFSKTITTSDLNCTFSELPDFARDYTFSIDALGMDEPAVITLPANPVVLEDLKAEYQEDGTVLVSWNTPAGSPAGGWHLTYNTVGSFHVSYLLKPDSEDMSANSAVLRDLIPNAEYEIMLHLVGEESKLSLYGQSSVTITTPEAEAFTGYSISPTPVYGRDSSNASLWLLPEKEDWTYKDLENLRTNFTKDEKIAICLQVESINASEDTVDLLYVIRNEDGQVVADEAQEFTWDSLWFERRHANAIPLPIKEGETTATSGSYTLEIYINGQLLLQRDFVIA